MKEIVENQSKSNLNYSELMTQFYYDQANNSEQKWLNKLIPNWYEKIFKSKPPNKHSYLISLRIEYYLFVKKLRQENSEISAKVMQNYIASQTYNIKGFTDSLQSVIALYVK